MNFLTKLFRGSRSIRQRLFWKLGVLSVGTLSVVNLIWLPSSIREIRQSQAELQRVAVRSVRDQIELFLGERERQLKSQAVLFGAPFVENNQEAVRLLAQRFLQRDPAFEEIGIVDREGKERFRLSRKLVITDQELRDLSVTPFYQEAMRGKLFWGSVFTTETSEPWITLAVPLPASGTTTIGVIFGVLSLKSLWDLTGEFQLTYGGRAYVVERTGRVIAADDSSLVLRQISFAGLPLIRQLTQPASSPAYSFVEDVYVNENKVSVTATGLLLPGPGWAVVVEQSQSLLYGPVKQKLWLSLAISLIGLLVSFGLARSLSSRLSGPIIRLREGVKLIGQGQFKHRVVVEGADEVGELATHFNAMAESLEEQEARRKHAEEQTQRHLRQIAALREINLAITSTLDLRAVLDVLLEKIDVSLPYAVATVRLLNRETGELESVACRNLDEEEWKAATRGARGGLGRMLPEDNSPVIVLNAQTDPRSLASEFLRKYGLVSYLRVPLIGKGQVLGVLTFFTRAQHQFSQEEIEFLTTLAGQAAIAIQNSQLFEQTKRQAIELEKANKVKDEFLGFVSHELRTPLNAIVGYTSMLEDKLLEDITPEQQETLGKIISRSSDLLNMINSLLEATRIEAGAVKVTTREIRPSDFLDSLRLGYEIPLGKELVLKWDYPPDLPVVRTDGEKLSHVLQNLIDNAVKFTEQGQVVVSAAVVSPPHPSTPASPQGGNRAREQTKKWLEFMVRDTGIGIAQESLPSIFDMFSQVDSSRFRSGSGVGLGLHIVKKFTELLRGEVGVESEPGKGSVFTVTIPCEN